MAYSISLSSGLGSVSATIKDEQLNAAMDRLKKEAPMVIANAIKDALREEATSTQRYIKGAVSPRQRYMGQRVADSIAVEMGSDSADNIVVRFGADPMDSGGPEGSRGGKLALILENGVRPYQYGFTFKSITNSPSWGSGAGEGGFINAKGNNMTHPGFKSIGWLTRAEEKATPEIGQRIADALREAFG